MILKDVMIRVVLCDDLRQVYRISEEAYANNNVPNVKKIDKGIYEVTIIPGVKEAC